MTRRLSLSLLVILMLGAACADDQKTASQQKEDECRLPSPQAGVDASLIPGGFLPPGDADVTQTEKRRGRLIAVLTLPGTIQSVLGEYRNLVNESGFDVLQEDNEGFEAELYLQRGRGDLAVVQIRETGCTETMLVLLNLPSGALEDN